MAERPDPSHHHLYELAEDDWKHGRLESAFRRFLAAAKGGVAPAYRVVAQFYDFGDGTKKNETAALYWYRRAYRERGDAVAANNIGCIFRDKKEIGKALWWLRRAVRLGDPEAHMSIARIYVDILADSAKATHELKKLLAAGDITIETKKEAEQLLSKLS